MISKQKFNFLFLLAFIIIPHVIFSQGKILPDMEMMLFLGRSPGKNKQNVMADYVLNTLYYKPQPKSGRKIGYLNNKGNLLSEARYDIGSDFYGNKANIIKDSVPGYIDKKGVVTLFQEYDETFFYYQKYGIAKKDGGYGLIDTNGNAITDFKYNSIAFYGFDHYLVGNKGGNSQVLTNDGKVIFGKYDELNINQRFFRMDSLLIYQNSEDSKLKGLMKVNGTIVLPPKYEDIILANNEAYLVVRNDKKFGLINRFGKELVPVIYDEIASNAAGTFIPAKKSGKWGYINSINEIQIPFIYDLAFPFFNNLAFVKKKDKIYCINRKNNIKINHLSISEKFPFFSEGYAVYKQNNKYGFINKRGKVKIHAKYDKVIPFYKNLACVELNGKVGFINKKGKEILPIKYKQLWLESDGMIRFAD